ncbi:MAG: hypothetical protein RB191_15465 [Terriglobia bacterium]|nr:hypothetical protein [Terriglobia bacterium]
MSTRLIDNLSSPAYELLSAIMPDRGVQAHMFVIPREGDACPDVRIAFEVGEHDTTGESRVVAVACALHAAYENGQKSQAPRADALVSIRALLDDDTTSMMYKLAQIEAVLNGARVI